MTALYPTRGRLARIQARRALLLWVMAIAVVLALPARAEVQEVRLGDRFYLIDLPSDSKDAPMILALHGGGGDPAQFAKASGIGSDAAARGYATIFPAGSSRRGRDRVLTWNGGYCCGHAARAGIDDLAFLSAVAADAAARFGLNGDKLFLTGMSNGSIMAETYAALRPGMLAMTNQARDAKDDGTDVTITDWSAQGSVQVRLITIDGGAHHWPGGRKARLTAGKTQEIAANAEILRFFDQFR